MSQTFSIKRNIFTLTVRKFLFGHCHYLLRMNTFLTSILKILEYQHHWTIMQTHPHQAGVTRILKSSPTCPKSYLFTLISALPNINRWVMNSEPCFFWQVKLKFWKLPSKTAVTLSHKIRHVIDILTYVTFTTSFLWLFFLLKFSC